MISKEIDGMLIRKWENETGYSIEISMSGVSKQYVKVSKIKLSKDEYMKKQQNIVIITDTMGTEHDFTNYANPSELEKLLNTYDEDDILTIRKGSVVAFITDSENIKVVIGFKPNELEKLNKKYFN